MMAAPHYLPLAKGSVNRLIGPLFRLTEKHPRIKGGSEYPAFGGIFRGIFEAKNNPLNKGPCPAEDGGIFC